MPSTRRRPETEFESTQTQLGTQTVTLNGMTGGFNSYTNPELLSPQFWAPPTLNVYSGMHGAIRRARWAPIANSSTFNPFLTGLRTVSLFSFAPTSATVTYLILDRGASVGGIFAPFILQWGPGLSIVSLTGISNDGVFTSAGLVGPYMRWAPNPAMILQANGLVRSKIYYNANAGLYPAVAFTLQLWGIDTPDTSPQITLAAGSTATIKNLGSNRVSNVAAIQATATLPANFIVGSWVNVSATGDTSFNTAAGTAVQITAITTVTNPNDTFSYVNIGPNSSGTVTGGTATVQITKSVGRSYSYAWENSITGHVSAPSPASEYVAYSNQTGTIDCIEAGTVTVSNATATVVGTNTFFTSAWVGRSLWVNGQGIVHSGIGFTWIISVTDATHLTLSGIPNANSVTQPFQIFDLQSDHIRLYATGNGGPVYLRIARNVFDNSATTLTAAGLRFIDNANSEPPNAPFTNEITQNQNVPPPIGSFLQDYQGRVLVYGVPGAFQSFFYSNVESTVVGQPPESFAILNEVTLPVGEARLNGMANLPTGLIQWSSKQDMFKLTGTLTDNTVANAQQLGATIQRLPYKIGCASPYATAVTSLGAFWLSSDREVWLFTDHYAPKNIGKPIQPLLSNATRISFAKMKNYKSGDRNWLALAITTKGGSFNDTLCLLDLDLLASNGQPSYFTFDMATNQPSWYIYNTNCEAIEAALDDTNINHLLSSDIDIITDLDWTDGYFTVTSEQSVPSSQLTLHSLGNQDPELIKTGRWMRVTTNQLPKNLASQGWNWNILCYDDDKYVLGINPQIVQLVPGINSPSQVFALEYSPSVFRFGGIKPVKGRRFQIQCNFPSGPGFYELRGYQVSYDQVVAR